MAYRKNGEIRWCVVGALMVQGFAAMGARWNNANITRENVPYAALRATLLKATPEGQRYVSFWLNRYGVGHGHSLEARWPCGEWCASRSGNLPRLTPVALELAEGRFCHAFGFFAGFAT